MIHHLAELNGQGNAHTSKATIVPHRESSMFTLRGWRGEGRLGSYKLAVLFWAGLALQGVGRARAVRSDIAPGPQVRSTDLVWSKLVAPDSWLLAAPGSRGSLELVSVLSRSGLVGGVPKKRYAASLLAGERESDSVELLARGRV